MSPVRVRVWAGRGAQGSLTLQVLRGRGERLVDVGRSAEETVPGPGPHVAKSDLAVAAGDRVALLVTPGAAVGIRRGTPRASIKRWIGPLLEPARPPERPSGTGFDHELLLRVDVSPDKDIDAIEPLTGEDAARAPAASSLLATSRWAAAR